MDGVLAALSTGSVDAHVRMNALLDHLPRDDGPAAVQRCDDVLAQALRMEFYGVAAKARLVRAQSLCRLGRHADAAAQAREVVAQIDDVPPADLYRGQAWWMLAQVFDAAGDGDDALIALARGTQWVRRVALPQVPDAYRDSFLHRNPSNQALLPAAASRCSAHGR